MRIKIERGGDRGVPQALLNDLWMHTGSQQLRGVAMSQIVKPDPGEVLDPRYQASELMRQALRLQRFAVGPRTHQGFACLPNAEHQKFFPLLALESPQFLDAEGGQGNGPSPVCLGA